ncbi:hypothetical protein X975_14232, partial [Stegodyphus mimosarum]
MMNVCIYSTNPARYQPKCFLCPTTVYPNVISRGKRSVAVGSENSLERDPSKHNSFGGVDQLAPLENASLSYDAGHSGNNQAFQIVGEEEVYASDYEEEGDYEDMTG